MGGKRQWIGAATGLLFLASCTASEEPRSSMPGPAPARAHAMTGENARCEGCHTEIAQEWRSSMHRQSHSDPAYQRALAREPLAFCENCHAPEARDEIGVACVSCHVTNASGRVLATEGGGRSAPHALERRSEFSSAAACAGCHEFEFPDREIRDAPEWMQRTVSEHRESSYSRESCASCHMPSVDGHRSHAFRSTRDDESMRRAVRIDARRDGSALTLTLTPNRVGHAFPSGDLFRRLAVTVEAIGDDFRVISAAQRYLSRHFASRLQKSGKLARVERLDDRVGPDARELHFDLGNDAIGRSIAWSVEYQRVDQLHGDSERRAVVYESIELGTGNEP